MEVNRGRVGSSILNNYIGCGTLLTFEFVVSGTILRKTALFFFFPSNTEVDDVSPWSIVTLCRLSRPISTLVVSPFPNTR